MSTSKHPKAEPGNTPRDDLQDNPEIGVSKGLGPGKSDARDVERGSTFEGDVENDTTPQGGADPAHRGRTASKEGVPE